VRGLVEAERHDDERGAGDERLEYAVRAPMRDERARCVRFPLAPPAWQHGVVLPSCCLHGIYRNRSRHDRFRARRRILQRPLPVRRFSPHLSFVVFICAYFLF
jgi:hypothetical protein